MKLRLTPFSVIPLILLLSILASYPISSTASQDVGATSISPCIQPREIVVNPATNKIYVANYFSNNIGVIDGDANLVTATIDVGTHAEMAVDSTANRVYAINSVSGSISVINGLTDSVVGQLNVRHAASHLALNPTLNRLYVTHTFGGNISVFDVQNMTEVNTVHVGFNPASLAVNPVTNNIYLVAGGLRGEVIVMDGNNYEIVAGVGININPDKIAVDSEANRVYVTSTYGLAILDGEKNEVILVVPSPLRVGFLNIAADSNASRVYVTTSTALLVVDGQHGGLMELVWALGCSGVAVNPATNRIYVTHPHFDMISVVNALNNIHLGIIPVGEDGSGHLEVSQPRVVANVALYPGITNLVSPEAIALNPQTNRIFVACWETNNVGVIDANTSQLISTVGVELGPNDLAVDPLTDRIYVSHWFSQSISVIDGQTNLVVKRISLDDWGTNAIALDSSAKRLYVVNSGLDSGGLLIIDMETGVTLATMAIHGPSDVAVNEFTRTIYLLHHNPDTVSVIDGTSNEVIETIELNHSKGSSPGIVVDSIRNRIYVNHVHGISVIDGETNEVLDEIPTYYWPARDIAIHPVTGNLYVVTGRELFIIDGHSLERVGQIELYGMHACVVDDVIGEVFVTALGHDTLTVLNATSCEALEVIPLGSVPSAVEVNGETDKIYVTNEDTDTVSVINGSTNEIISSIKVGDYPACLEVDSEKNRVYVATAEGLYIIDGVTDTVMATVEYSSGTRGPFDIAFNPSTELIYVTTDPPDNIIIVIDSERNVVVDEARCLLVRGIAVNPETNKLYAECAVSSGFSPTIESVETIWTPWGTQGYRYSYRIGEVYTGSLLGGIMVFDGSNETLSWMSTLLYSPDVFRGRRLPLAVDPSLNVVYAAPNVVWRTEGQALVIEGENDSIVEGLHLPGAYSMDFRDIAVDQETSSVYVLMKDDYIVVLDGNTFDAESLVHLGPRCNADRIAINTETEVVYAANSGTGTISVIETRDNPPVAFFQHSPKTLYTNQDIVFDASYSYDPDGDPIISHNWDFGDGNITGTPSQALTHKYAVDNIYTVTLNVTNSQGLWSITSKTITVNLDNTGPNIARMIQNPPVDKVNPNENVTVTAVNVTDNAGVKNVLLRFSTDNVTFTNVTMTPVIGTHNYTGQIQGQAFGTYVTYKIFAKDTNGNWVETVPHETAGIYRVIPEFPSLLILPLLMMATLLATVFYRRRHQHLK